MTKTNVDDTDIINFRYKDGTLASLTCSITADTDNTAIIYGEKGKIVIPNFGWQRRLRYIVIAKKKNLKIVIMKLDISMRLQKLMNAYFVIG